MTKAPVMNSEFKKYQLPAVAVDIILFSLQNNKLQVALVKRNEEPFLGKYAIPGRFVRYDEPIEETAKLVIKDKAGIKTQKFLLHQLYTFGQNLHRDTRIRTISIVYYAILSQSEKEYYQNCKLKWFDINSLPKLSFDHKEIISYAKKRLSNRIIWTDEVFNFLDDEFTLTEVQKAHEIISGEELDKRNFRKKLLTNKKLKKTNKTKINGVHRPAALYVFKV